MNIKELIVPLSFALLTTVAIQYFFFSSTPPQTSVSAADQSFVAPTTQHAAEPLDLEVDFVDTKETRPEQFVSVPTNYGVIDFSNNGAIINRIAYKHESNELIQTLNPAFGKENGAFLVALNGTGNTPYYYDLVDQKKGDTSTVVSFKGESATARVLKEFVVHHDICKIDLNVTIEPKGKESLRPRIFFPAPFLLNATEPEIVSAVFYTEKHAFERKSLKDLAQFGKVQPTFFGLEDRYFLNTLAEDPDHFAQRAYFKPEGADKAQAILQAGFVNQKTKWNVSFYVGPKEAKSLTAVNPKLDGIIDYGWFGFIAKPMLSVLNYLYGVVQNYGLAILLLTLLIRLLMVPFTLGAEGTRRKHAEAQRKLKYIEQRYKDDHEALAREKAEFARKHGIPGALGCLPLLLQIPVFIGLNKVLANAFELYKAPFLWISDLSARDPYYILPIAVGLTMMLQLMQTGDARQRLMNFILAIIITAVTSTLSAGLTLFIGFSTFLGVAQTWIQGALKR